MTDRFNTFLLQRSIVSQQVNLSRQSSREIPFCNKTKYIEVVFRLCPENHA